MSVRSRGPDSGLGTGQFIRTNTPRDEMSRALSSGRRVGLQSEMDETLPLLIAWYCQAKSFLCNSRIFSLRVFMIDDRLEKKSIHTVGTQAPAGDPAQTCRRDREACSR